MSDGGGVVCRYDEVAAAVLAAPARLGPVRLVAVDGPAGSGKTTLAGRLAGALEAAGAVAPVLGTDDLLDGWGDTVTFWPRLERWVLGPLRRGEAAVYRRYDWYAGRFGAERHRLEPPDVLVLEGVTSARAAVAGELTRSLFVCADRHTRLARGMERDGEALRGEWLGWMAREDRHFAVDDTRRRVDDRVDGAPTAPHDPVTEFVRLPPLRPGGAVP